MPAAERQAVELSIGAMTCACCAARIEKSRTKWRRSGLQTNSGWPEPGPQ